MLENRWMTHPRVFFDTNDGSMQRGYWLGFDRSQRDLESLGDKLQEGAIVTIYMPDELEMTATLRFEATEGTWWADPLRTTN